MNKRAVIDLAVIFFILIIVLFIGWFVKENWKQCRYDADCKENQYCGSDFGCHDFKVVVKEVKVSPPPTYTLSAWIIGISLVLAAMILKWGSIFGKKTDSKDETIQGSYSYKAGDASLSEKDAER